MTEYDRYRSPLETRYASPQMQVIWSAQRKFSTWRRLWLALAQSQQELGLEISDEQIEQIQSHLDDIDFDAAAKYEKKLRHDVMAHVYTLGDQAPLARPILHLGATSQFVNCNTELILLRDSLQLIAQKLARVIDALGTFSIENRDLPTLAFTHYQPAQPTTVGKRAAVWAYDLILCLEDIEYRLDSLRFRGVKGTTGTQASFLALFDGDETRVEKLDELVTKKMGWPIEQRFLVTGQTYPRLVDAQVMGNLATTASAIHKIATDLRLLANHKELEEPFGTDQIGSSAMAYKRNPMRCERACAMSRFVMSLVQNSLNTAATQWLERTLDDSANRRLVLPEGFLALDGVLDIMHNVVSGLVVYEKTIRSNLMAELPFMASENILMAAVRDGADRQEAHEIIRRHSQDAAHLVKSEGLPNDLLERLKTEPMFAKIDFNEVLDPMAYVGRAPEQVDQFVNETLPSIRERYAEDIRPPIELKV
ncbi:MAG: adenylosuccinate lyase [Planctomycetota bacterium]|nr:adenylosuccinate lyase [Planctomycetota bacterium]